MTFSFNIFFRNEQNHCNSKVSGDLASLEKLRYSSDEVLERFDWLD